MNISRVKNYLENYLYIRDSFNMFPESLHFWERHKSTTI